MPQVNRRAGRVPIRMRAEAVIVEPPTLREGPTDTHERQQ